MDANSLIHGLTIGTCATALLDLAAIARMRLLRTPLPDYGLVGRWIGHMRHGSFRHPRIAGATALQGERLIGWVTHYLVGIAFASLLPAVWGQEWIRHPTIGPALIVGIGGVAAPFLIMQPAMGAGIAANHTPRPAIARLQSLTTHLLFGLAVYVAGWANCLFYRSLQ